LAFIESFIRVFYSFIKRSLSLDLFWGLFDISLASITTHLSVNVWLDVFF